MDTDLHTFKTIGWKIKSICSNSQWFSTHECLTHADFKVLRHYKWLILTAPPLQDDSKSPTPTFDLLTLGLLHFSTTPIKFSWINWPWRTIMGVSFPWNSFVTLLFTLKGGASMPFQHSLTNNKVPEMVNIVRYTEQWVKEPILRDDLSHLWAVVLLTNWTCKVTPRHSTMAFYPPRH